MQDPHVLIAGASGYIGKEIITKILQEFPTCHITALSRNKQTSTDPRVEWKSCDLFSLKSLEESIPKKVDVAFYLVHSMGPTAKLDQGSFADYDLILADNFSRALKPTGIKQVIYLGGLIPPVQKLSLHLQSRLEVEKTFEEYGLPTTIFRAGLILGDAGSSFQILVKLVNRLPLMICPQWTQTMTAPVDLKTVLHSLTSAMKDSSHIGKVYDLAGCEPLSYMQMMSVTAKAMGKKRFFMTVPFFTPTLSRLWVSLITGAPKNLVYPLIESLKHPMVFRPTHLFSNSWQGKKYEDLLSQVSFQTKPSRKFFTFSAETKTVRSVQRLPLPQGKNAKWVTDCYLEWLPKFLKPFIHVAVKDHKVIFGMFGDKLKLLEMQVSPERSNPDRQLLYIVGGLLSSKGGRGRLEFRVVLNREYVIAAIHDFKPALPWFIYKYTQAKLHLFVMNKFAKHLQQKK
ncbi:MAG: NAD(P)H-binding protein [Bacteriovoracaceae bacterium]|nr:NAD(P)H-binding protein [Bacteriovoracaceae bacterium]